jgi:hypothetical protein
VAGESAIPKGVGIDERDVGRGDTCRVAAALTRGPEAVQFSAILPNVPI